MPPGRRIGYSPARFGPVLYWRHISTHQHQAGGTRMVGRRALLVMLLATVTACGQGTAPNRATQPAGGAAPVPVGQDRTVTMAVRYEPPTLVPKAGSGLTNGAVRPFNAALFLVDGDGVTKPYLAA